MPTYPDIIGEYVNAEERYTANGLQYAGYYEQPKIVPGQVTNFFLFLQNTFNVPLEANLKFTAPQSGGFLRSKNPTLAIGADETTIRLGGAEVGLLTLPLIATEHAEDGQHALTVEVKVATQGKGERIRPEKSQSQIDYKLIDSPIGLNLVSSTGANYSEKNTKKASFEVDVSGDPLPTGDTPDLSHNFETIWKKSQAKFFGKALQEVNSREGKIRKELTTEALYATLFSESTERFADVGLPLRIGEAIMLAKILTYSCQYFLSDTHRRHGLLVPIWEQALELEEDTVNSLRVIKTIGYYHVIKLAIATSFGLIQQSFGREFWPPVERRAVASHIADNIEIGQPLETDFLYLPLLMAGTQVCSKVKLQGENVSESLALMKKARAARTELFSHKEMAQPNKIFNHIMKKAG